MTQGEKIQFVKELTGSIQQTVFDAILEGKIPENWDGIELRWYLAELFERSASFGSKPRKREYNNTVLVNDL
jgi:hypothetical protein